MKRATVYFDDDLHRALKLKAFEAERSISDLVNEAVRGSLDEDRIDLRTIRSRAKEKTVPYAAFLKKLGMPS